MFSGKQPTPGRFSSGGNKERESFNKKVSSVPQSPTSPRESRDKGGSDKTEITHNRDGSHSVLHSDGEKSEHPNAGHMAAHIHAKHEGGEVGNIHARGDGGATTHHVGVDGMVEGPTEHDNINNASDHLTQMLCDGGAGASPEHPDMATMGGEENSGLY